MDVKRQNWFHLNQQVLFFNWVDNISNEVFLQVKIPDYPDREDCNAFQYFCWIHKKIAQDII